MAESYEKDRLTSSKKDFIESNNPRLNFLSQE